MRPLVTLTTLFAFSPSLTRSWPEWIGISRESWWICNTPSIGSGNLYTSSTPRERTRALGSREELLTALIHLCQCCHPKLAEKGLPGQGVLAVKSVAGKSGGI